MNAFETEETKGKAIDTQQRRKLTIKTLDLNIIKYKQNTIKNTEKKRNLLMGMK